MINKFNYLIIIFGIFAPLTLFSQQSSAYYTETLQSTTSQGVRQRTPVKIYTDTVKRVYKELVQELPAEKNALIKIVNTTCNLDIRPWSEAKVKLVTTIGVPEKDIAKVTQEQIMEQAGVIFKSFGNRVNLQTRTSFNGGEVSNVSLFNSVGPGGRSYTSKQGNVYVSGATYKDTVIQSNNWMTTGATVRNVILYVPDGCRLDVDNKNTGILINGDIEDARFELSRSTLDARNFKKLFITADYYSINISDVQEAELELENGNFTGGIIKTLDLDSKGSEIEYESGEVLYVRSQSDRISLDEVGKVDGRKLFGDFRIGKLKSSLDLEGTNTDVRIRNIAATTELVRINNRFANLRIPVKNLTGFDVDFTGASSTVFAPFEKVAKADTITTSDNKKIPAVIKTKPSLVVDGKEQIDGNGAQLKPEVQTLLSKIPQSNNMLLENLAPVRFTASGGDKTGKHTIFNIICSQCTVDFK